MVKQAIDADEGFALVDPHGQEAEEVLALIPPQRWRDVCYLDPLSARPVAFNPLEEVPRPLRDAATDEIVATLAGKWGMTDSSHPWQLQLLRHGVRLLLDCPETTLYTLYQLFKDEKTRVRLRRKATNKVNKDFWYETNFKDKEWGVSLKGVCIRLEALVMSDAGQNLLCQPHSTINFKDMMDNGHILIVNLNKGRVGEHVSHMIGTFLVSALIQSAFTRSLQFHQRPFFVFVDEYQNFVTDTFASALSEIRKYGVGLTLAHQYMSQVPEHLTSAVLGNTGTTIAFRVGAEDAPKLAGQFGLHSPVSSPDLTVHDTATQDYCDKGLHSSVVLSRQPNFEAWARVLQGGAPLAVRLQTVPPPSPVHDRTDKLLQNSRVRFGSDRALVEMKINQPRKKRKAPKKRRYLAEGL